IAALDQGDRAGAERLYRASVEEYKKLGPAYEAHLAVTELNLAQVLSANGNRDEALPMYQGVLAVLRRTLGDKNLHTVSALNLLAGAYFMSADYHRAEPLYEEALKTARECFPTDVETARALGGLASIRLRDSQIDAVLPLAEESL